MIEFIGPSLRELTHRARAALGLDDLVLVVHDASFPSDDGEDLGRGTPYSKGAHRLYDFADVFGFTGLQLGPQGVTTRVNRSPYDGSVFSRSPLSIALADLCRDPAWEAVLDAPTFEDLLARVPSAGGRVLHDFAEDAVARCLGVAHRRFVDRGSPALRERFASFREEAAAWLDHDVAFEIRAAHFGSDDPARWTATEPSSPAAHEAGDRYAFAQFVVHAQHDAFRQQMRRRGWKVFGDLQIGLSPRDRWRREDLFLAAYALGAPPSRTDPLGQPWGYGVLRPDSVAATDFFRARVRKMAREYDGIRIDHPHGLVCPWVYDRHAVDLLAAVAGGARLFESPDLPDHPRLAAYAIARPDQIDRSVPRHDDRWVRALDESQIERYAERMAILLGELSAAGGSDVVCEVLSTSPRPLVEVLRRYDLGRFRVTQKAALGDPRDGYRSENASPRDWIMVGTHDTAPVANVVDGWFSSGNAHARATYLAGRLAPDATREGDLARELAASPAAMTRAMFADLFASPARHALVFMSDFFGLRDVYNRPGIVNEANWGLRIANDFERLYRQRLQGGAAMDVVGAMAMALRARVHAADHANAHAALASQLDQANRAHRDESGSPD
jgi:4-alpha-glucanotransferase